MKINDVILETSAYVSNLRKFALGHYPDESNPADAVDHLLSRSVHHAEDDDHRQDIELSALKQQLADLTNRIQQLQNQPTFVK